jgi:hypothetical protein
MWVEEEIRKKRKKKEKERENEEMRETVDVWDRQKKEENHFFCFFVFLSFLTAFCLACGILLPSCLLCFFAADRYRLLVSFIRRGFGLDNSVVCPVSGMSGLWISFSKCVGWGLFLWLQFFGLFFLSFSVPLFSLLFLVEIRGSRFAAL